MWPSPTLEAGIAVWPESPRDDGQNVQGRPVHVVSVRQNMVVGSSCPFLREGVIEAFVLERMSCTWTRPSSSLSERASSSQFPSLLPGDFQLEDPLCLGLSLFLAFTINNLTTVILTSTP